MNGNHNQLMGEWAFGADSMPAVAETLVENLVKPVFDMFSVDNERVCKTQFAEIIVNCICSHHVSEADIEALMGYSVAEPLVVACQTLLNVKGTSGFWRPLAATQGWRTHTLALLGGKIQDSFIKLFWKTPKDNAAPLYDWTVTLPAFADSTIATTTTVEYLDTTNVYTFAPKHDEAFLELGTPYLATAADATKRLQAASGGVIDKLISEHLILAGGSVKKAVTGKHHGTSDFDMWFVGLETMDDIHAELDRAMNVLEQESSTLPVMTRMGSTVSVEVTINEQQLKFQFPLRAYKCVAQVVHSFDCAPVQCAYTVDGFVLSAAAVDALVNRVCVVDPTMSTTTDRYLKQHAEGFTLVGPITADLPSALGAIAMMTQAQLRKVMALRPGTFTSLLCAAALIGRRKSVLTAPKQQYSASGSVTAKLPAQPMPIAWTTVNYWALLAPRVHWADPTLRMRAPGSQLPYVDMELLARVVPSLLQPFMRVLARVMA